MQQRTTDDLRATNRSLPAPSQRRSGRARLWLRSVRVLGFHDNQISTLAFGQATAIHKVHDLGRTGRDHFTTHGQKTAPAHQQCPMRLCQRRDIVNLKSGHRTAFLDQVSIAWGGGGGGQGIA